jgi:hypothetical protein
MASFLSEMIAQSSVLSSGDWYKIGVEQKGIYKIDASILQGLGINSNNIDPRNIAIYGNGGGGMLPQPNNVPRENDLVENAIFVSGEADGAFDANDYILFYGNGPDKIEFDLNSNEFIYEKNLYSDTVYYFLSIKNSFGKRIESRTDKGTGSTIVNSHHKITIYEKDLFNLISSGREWLGENISSGNNFKSSFGSENLVPNSEIKAQISLLAQSFKPASFDIKMNGITVYNQPMDTIYKESDTENRGDLKTAIFSVNSSNLANVSNGIDIEIVFNKAEGVTSVGYLDYINLLTQHRLSIEGSTLPFHLTNTLVGSRVELSNFTSDIQIWDVSNPTNVIEQQFTLNGNNASYTLEEQNSEFYAFKGNDFVSPIVIGKLKNQNLHALAASEAIFITHINFLDQAQQLANHRRAHDGMSIEIVLIDKIYNEFSSGAQDVTAIRDFLKHNYETNSQQLKYVLMFGDCSYDYKGRVSRQTNFVPIYQSRNSLINVESYPSEDYFGFFEDTEGEWKESSSGDHTVEIGIGRLPVKTFEEAKTVVNKIIRYETSPNALGNWRNNVVFIADDADNNIHSNDADKMAKYVDTIRSEFNIKKIYLDSYHQIALPAASNGILSPDARSDFERALNEGIFILNYTGHGNQSQLVQENIIDLQSINAMTNRNKLPFFITATCNFGSYDDPLRVSGGEQMVLSANGGAIGLLTSTRKVFAHTNFIINRAYYFAAMEKINGSLPRLGDVIRHTKNNSLQGVKNRNYALMGDPTMRLSYPKSKIEITLVNGKQTSQNDTIKAQQTVSMAGEILSSNGQLQDNFSGIISIEAFDKESEFKTLGDEDGFPAVYKQREILLFKGEATVSNGMFNFDFVVPKNIAYDFGEGKINMYALSDDKSQDAIGANAKIIIGGSSTPSSDQIAPEIDVYLNDINFTSGYTVSQNPVLLAKLFDESGINISTEGFGKNITYILDDQEPVILNEYYTASLDTYKEGWVSYDLTDIPIGSHVIKFKAYDTNNNPAETSINFSVKESNDIKLTNVFIAPNPVYKTNSITLNFTHDRVGEELLVSIQVINMQGRVITEEAFRFDDVFEATNTIQWDMKNSKGNRIKKGMYIFRLTVQSTLDGGKNEVNKRLIILN